MPAVAGARGTRVGDLGGQAEMTEDPRGPSRPRNSTGSNVGMAHC